MMKKKQLRILSHNIHSCLFTCPKLIRHTCFQFLLNLRLKLLYFDFKDCGCKNLNFPNHFLLYEIKIVAMSEKNYDKYKLQCIIYIFWIYLHLSLHLHLFVCTSIGFIFPPPFPLKTSTTLTKYRNIVHPALSTRNISIHIFNAR